MVTIDVQTNGISLVKPCTVRSTYKLMAKGSAWRFSSSAIYFPPEICLSLYVYHDKQSFIQILHGFSFTLDIPQKLLNLSRRSSDLLRNPRQLPWSSSCCHKKFWTLSSLQERCAAWHKLHKAWHIWFNRSRSHWLCDSRKKQCKCRLSMRMSFPDWLASSMSWCLDCQE